ncbi:hypothetical protein J6590_018109 [Homalodisca vitripennis]|nr:hypothetical protein J6590_018109 [Homalodisca vitripennis]
MKIEDCSSTVRDAVDSHRSVSDFPVAPRRVSDIDDGVNPALQSSLSPPFYSAAAPDSKVRKHNPSIIYNAERVQRGRSYKFIHLALAGDKFNCS